MYDNYTSSVTTKEKIQRLVCFLFLKTVLENSFLKHRENHFGVL